MKILGSPFRKLTVLWVAVLLGAACSDDPGIEAFCDAAQATHTAGPLFPDRTDGEPVANPAALVALEQMADTAPDEIESHLDTLVTEARYLVTEANARATASTSPGPTTEDSPGDGTEEAARPDRNAVEAAQAATAEYVTQECDLNLNS